MLKTINVEGKLIDFAEPRIMGILNITPDSFYSGSRLESEKSILHLASKMLEDNATFLDIGGYSSRPGAEDIPEEEEIKRVVSAVALVKKEYPDAVISVDTFRVKVAEKAIAAGAAIVNDISGGHLDQRMWNFIAESRVPYIAMHMKGTPQTMKKLNTYEDMIKEITYYFSVILDYLDGKGVKDVIIDPGFGFAKNIDQNFELLRNLDYFHILERPLLVGVSRKSMIYKSLNKSPEDALNGTTVLNTVALLKGASILRVHDVKEAHEAVLLLKKGEII